MQKSDTALSIAEASRPLADTPGTFPFPANLGIDRGVGTLTLAETSMDQPANKLSMPLSVGTAIKAPFAVSDLVIIGNCQPEIVPANILLTSTATDEAFNTSSAFANHAKRSG